MIYTDGTIAIKAGSPIVTGTGTQWKKNIHGVAPGQLISIENGAAPVSMMIRAVNSDTELVLSFNAPVTLSGAKYSIATTVPDTISDAARTMSANQGYIVYFLQAMQQWMTDTGQVEIELPNGQKVTLDSIKAMNDAIQGASTTRKGIVKLVKGLGDSAELVMPQSEIKKAFSGFGIGEAIPLHGFQEQNLNDYKMPGIYCQAYNANCKPENNYPDSYAGVLEVLQTIGSPGNACLQRYSTYTKLSSYVRSFANGAWSSWVPISNGMILTEDGNTTSMKSPNTRRLILVTKDTGEAGIWDAANTRWVFHHNQASATMYGSCKFISPGDYSSINLTKSDGRYVSIETTPHAGSVKMINFIYRQASGENQYIVNIPYTSGTAAIIGGNTYFDGSGYLKKSSPIIQIHPDGNYETNDESEGAEVRRTGTGQYHITGILGYNSDGAWGVNGGISVPKDNNGLELVYVDDRVQSDGSLIIETCHRQHAHLPERFQNWRLKDITPEGERIFYQDGEPCDLPESTRLDVRVEMPQGSVWNVKQRELAEQMEREQVEREARGTVELVGDTEE
ncbi:pyocin knob domain-containing protein [Morganella morganii]